MPPSLFGPAITDRLQEHHRSFTTAQPFRHIVLDDFLAPELCRRLVEQFPPFDEAGARNELGHVGGKCTHEKVRRLGSAYAALDDFVRSRAFLDVIGAITGIEDLRYDPHYIGGGTHENRTGQGLDPHVDFNYHPVTHLHRRLNLILYLNQDWQEHWGGAIQLHSNPWEPDEDTVKTVLPVMNRCVLFETNERSWHGFQPITRSDGERLLSRRSFALYLYTETRPADEISAPHSTFYVHAPLPLHLRPGVTLTEQDYQSLRALMSSRNRWMRHLYDKEKEYRGEIERLKLRLHGGSLGWLRRMAQVVAPLATRRRRLLDRLIGKNVPARR